MRTNVLWKLILVLAITGLSVFFYFNNGLKLGLDLEGGVHLVMIMDPAKSVDAAVNSDVTTMKEQLTKSNVPFDDVYPLSDERGVMIIVGKDPNLGPEVDRICDVALSRYNFSSREGGQFALTLKDFEIQVIEVLVDEELDRFELVVVHDETPVVELLALQYGLHDVVVPMQLAAWVIVGQEIQLVRCREVKLLADSEHE